MDTIVTATFLTKLFEFVRLEFQICSEFWFCLYVTTLMAGDNLLQKVKVPKTIQIGSNKQEANKSQK